MTTPNRYHRPRNSDPAQGLFDLIAFSQQLFRSSEHDAVGAQVAGCVVTIYCDGTARVEGGESTANVCALLRLEGFTVKA